MISIESILAMLATETSELSLAARLEERQNQERFLVQLEHWSGRHLDCRDCELSVLTEEEVRHIREMMKSGKTGDAV